MPPVSHRAVPDKSAALGDFVLCRVCGEQVTFIHQTNQPDQWRHRKRARGVPRTPG